MPDANFDAIGYLKRRTHLLRCGLLQRLDEISVSDYPAETPNELISFLQDFLKEIEEVVEKTSSEDKLKQLNFQIRDTAQFLDFLDNAHTGQTPRSLTQMLKHLIGQLSTGSRVIVRPQAQYNYSIADLQKFLQYLVETYIPHSKQAQFENHLATPLKLISFPRIERDNVLAHAIFGHELGHPVASEFLEREEREDAYQQAQSDIQQKILTLVEAAPDAATLDATKKFELQAFVFKNVLQVRRRAMEELVSDAVGVLLFGPSALFAMYEILWGSNWDTPPSRDEWYPPSRMRLRLMLNLADELHSFDALWAMEGMAGFEDYVRATKAFVDQARELVKETTDESQIESDATLQLAYHWMKNSFGAAVAYAKERTKATAFNMAPITDEMPQLLRRLELGIPPNEVGEPDNLKTVDYRASLLAAWMFKLRGISSKTGNVLSSDEVGGLYLQTMSAIEFVILRNEYDEHTKKALAS